jgi:nucleoredoxin
MSRLLLFALALFAALPVLAVPPPMTAKDVALMARSGYAESEILAEVQKRHFAAPIDAAMEKAMLDGGAPAALIAKLKATNFVLAPEQQAALARKASLERAATMEREQHEELFLAQRRAEAASLASSAAARDNIQRLLEGRLVRLQSSEVVPYSASNLRDVRLYAFYYSASWCGPCRKATPKLIEWYRRTKPAHPEFELIFVSNDQTEVGMADYMRKDAMPWPAVRYSETRDPALKQFAGESIPWLVAISRAGQPMSQNGIDKKYIDPDEMMQGIDFLLAELQKPGAKLKGE